LLIKIAIGFGVLLIIGGGVGAYFFFMAEEPAVEEISSEFVKETTGTDVSSENTIDMDNLIDASESTPSEVGNEDAEGAVDSSSAEESLSDAEKILQMREDAVTLQEENLRLKMQLNEIEGKEPAGTEGVSAETTVKEGDSIANVKPETKQYLDLYGEESQTYPSVRLPKREPIPEPKWGD